MKTLELIHCYQHLLANPAKIRRARLCTQSLCFACAVCLLNIQSPPASLKKLLRIRWLLANTDHHEHWTTCLPLLCSLLVHPSAASFENVLKNRCLPLNTDYLEHSLSHLHVLFPPRLAFPASFENVLNFRCLLGARICPTFDAQYFLMFPRLSPFHYSAIFENVLCIHWFYCAVPSPLSFAHFFAHLFAPVLHLLYFPVNLWNVLGNRCFVAPSHNFPLCPRPLFPSPLFSLVNHLSLSPLLHQTEGLVCPWLLTTISNFFNNFLTPVHLVIVVLPFHLALCT